MAEIRSNEILTGHYTTETKVKKSEHKVVQGPSNLPKYDLYTDKKASAKLQSIERDIYTVTSDVKKQNAKKKKFLGIF